MNDLISDFIAETREGLEVLDIELVKFEQDPSNIELLSGVFRLIHTIKGTCGFLGLVRLQSVAHAAENVLAEFRSASLDVTPAAVSAILDTVDAIRTLVGGLARHGAEPAGDDAELIGRLEDVLKGQASAVAAPPPPDGLPLLQRLGGEATVDAAVETALIFVAAHPVLKQGFAGVDLDQLQGGLRNGLVALTSSVRGAQTFPAVVGALAAKPLDARALSELLELICEALASLEVGDAGIAELRLRAMPSPEGSPSTEPAVCTPLPAPAAKRASAPAASDAEIAEPAQTIRVSVSALEHLMTVVSELVLIRNQLIQVLRLEPESPFAAPLNRLNQVTTELQEGVMTTRMQPISGAWAKLPRLVRDLAQDLDKKIELTLHGQETELDRQVLELIKDPLTHMIRNAADHGLETVQERLAAGKSEAGRITLQARHEGGAIVIEVMDDGRGLSASKLRAKAVVCGLVSAPQAEAMSDSEARHLIFRAGFSTAAQVTAVSGRGVGMDVVRTNIERIGGAIELTSTEGVGTRFTIRIPLTLTIVSALIVECCGERFAMPQSCVVELVSAKDGSGRVIEYVDEAAVLRLRDRLLPLVSLGALLGLPPAEEAASESCIVVARVGGFEFGVIVDKVFDTEEIVVKPVATVLRHLKIYSGATILGDGSVILILDFKGISQEAGASQGADASDIVEATAATALSETALLIFLASDRTPKAVSLSRVARIEETASAQIEQVEGRTVIQYRGALMPVTDVAGHPVTPWSGEESRPLLVFSRDDQTVGLLVDEIVDIVEVPADEVAALGGGNSSLIVAGRATEMIDIERFWGRRPALVYSAVGAPSLARAPSVRKLLVIDQSPFSRMLLQPLLAQAGYEVSLVEDAAGALELYHAGEEFHLIMAEAPARGEAARRFALEFGQATGWHATPLLGLSLQGAGRSPQFDSSSVLDAVSSAFADLQAAA